MIVPLKEEINHRISMFLMTEALPQQMDHSVLDFLSGSLKVLKISWLLKTFLRRGEL